MGSEPVDIPKGPFIAVTAFLAVLVAGAQLYLSAVPGHGVPVHILALYMAVIALPVAFYGISTVMGSVRLEDGFLVLRFGVLLTAAVPLAAVRSAERLDAKVARSLRMGVRADGRSRSASVVTDHDDVVTLRLSRPIPIKAGLVPKRIETLHLSVRDPAGVLRLLGVKGVPVLSAEGENDGAPASVPL